jgi:ferredoxin
MTYIPTIDEATCIGQGDCAELLPEVFRIEDVATVIGEGPDEALLEAARGCPVEAIALRDADTGEQVYP